MSTLTSTIKALLTEKPELRENDQKLCVAVWWTLNGKTDKGFFLRYSTGELPTASAIIQLRIHLQDKYQNLRSKRREETEKIQALNSNYKLF